MTVDQGHMDFVMKNAAEHYGCKVSDLEYRVDKFGAIHVRLKGKSNGKENGDAQQESRKDDVKTDGHETTDAESTEAEKS